MGFIDDNFLLSSEVAKKLYHGYAKNMPIADYHCHIDPKEIYEDRRFNNITELWLGADHYKWRIMRADGVSEYYITGNAPDREKFQKFSEALEGCIGNPMYHWCHLELKNYFGYDGVLNGKTAELVWNLTKEKLSQNDFSARSLIIKSNVSMIGTTDDPTSELKYHQLLSKSDFPVKVLPSFRPDKALNIHKAGFKEYISDLSMACGFEIESVSDVCAALTKRLEFFKKMGCRASDHGLDYVMYRFGTEPEIESIFEKAMAGGVIDREEAEKYQTHILLHCAREYKRLGIVMQLHFSCKRNPNSKMFDLLGADTGFDCMASTDSCEALYSLMDALEREEKLPKTVLYSLNPADDAWIDTLIGAFHTDGIRGKIQHGSAWWFNDNRLGMEKQMTSLANLGILGNFIGMLTDSRSLLSYARHEYFRRILCNLIGKWVDGGEYPSDERAISRIVENICYNNAKEYFEV